MADLRAGKEPVGAGADRIPVNVPPFGSIVDLLLVGFFSGLHVLIEAVPGVGKTTLAKSLSASGNNGPAGVGITLRV